MGRVGGGVQPAFWSRPEASSRGLVVGSGCGRAHDVSGGGGSPVRTAVGRAQELDPALALLQTLRADAHGVAGGLGGGVGTTTKTRRIPPPWGGAQRWRHGPPPLGRGCEGLGSHRASLLAHPILHPPICTFAHHGKLLPPLPSKIRALRKLAFSRVRLASVQFALCCDSLLCCWFWGILLFGIHRVGNRSGGGCVCDTLDQPWVGESGRW